MTSDFWNAFWPNLTSTLVGVGLGIPIGLYLNRLNVRHADALRARTERARIRDLLSSLRRSLQSNLSRLKALGQQRERGQLTYPVYLDVSSWDVLGLGLAGALDDPELLTRLAHHYDRLKQLRKLNEELLDVMTGARATISGSEKVQEALVAEYNNEIRELTADCEGLIDRVSVASQRLDE